MSCTYDDTADWSKATTNNRRAKTPARPLAHRIDLEQDKHV
jgi:hypothetical protein